MNKTTTWICDTCRQLIEQPEDAWVEWISFTERAGECNGRDPRIVHHKPSSPSGGKWGCQYDEKWVFQQDKSIVSGLHLPHFRGPDGLMFLLSMIVDKTLPVDQVLELIKRIHIPRYEHARLYFDAAIEDGVFEPNMPKDFYWQSDIEATLEYAKRERK